MPPAGDAEPEIVLGIHGPRDAPPTALHRVRLPEGAATESQSVGGVLGRPLKSLPAEDAEHASVEALDDVAGAASPAVDIQPVEPACGRSR